MPGNYVFQFISRVIRALQALLPDEALQNLLANAASTRALKLSPAKGLRFLFGLDTALYPLQGRLAVEYDGGIHTKHRHTGYHDFFVRRVRKGERVLDISCGNGALSFDLAEKSGANVAAIDLDPENIKTAQENYAHSRIVYRQCDVLTASLDGSFDTIVLSNVLEHLPNRSEFLRKTVERIRPSRIILRVPVFERDWRVPLKQELGIDFRLDNTHLTEYTLESFAAEMAAANLLVVHQEVRWSEIWAEAVPQNSVDRDHTEPVEKRH